MRHEPQPLRRTLKQNIDLPVGKQTLTFWFIFPLDDCGPCAEGASIQAHSSRMVCKFLFFLSSGSSFLHELFLIIELICRIYIRLAQFDELELFYLAIIYFLSFFVCPLQRTGTFTS